MKSKIFNGSQAKNKETAAEIVAKYVSTPEAPATLDKRVDTGGPIESHIAVQSPIYGQLHVTCSSLTGPNDAIWGWAPADLKKCAKIDHVAFVWADKTDAVFIAILTKDQCIELGELNKGQYSRAELKSKSVVKTKIPYLEAVAMVTAQ